MSRRRRKTRGFGLPNWVLVLAFIGGLYLLFEGERQKERPTNPFDKTIDESLAEERRQKPESAVFGGRVFLFASKRRFNEADVHRMSKNTSGDHISVWSIGRDKSAFATAPGYDRVHHFVNAFLEGYQPFETDNLFVPLMTLARTKTYQFDHLDVTGHQELWQTSREAFYYARGDCEDHALALADWLIEMGEDARVVSGRYKGEGHAWVILFKDGQTYLFEATSKRGLKTLPLASMFPEYNPQWMFNREHFWYNSGSPRTVVYDDKKWIKKSRYEKDTTG